MPLGAVYAVALDGRLTPADNYLLREWGASLLRAGWSSASAGRASNRLRAFSRVAQGGLVRATRQDVIALAQSRGKSTGTDLRSLIRSEGWRQDVRTIRAFYRWATKQYIGVAGDPKAKGRGVLVVMNDTIHAAHSLTKTSTTAVQTFLSPIRGVVGTANYGKNDFFSSPEWKHTTQTEFDISSVTTMPRVDIIYASMDMSPALIEASANGAKGIVIAGVGNGNMNKASVDAAAAAVKKGVVVVRSSRVTTGNVGRNVELDDDKLGFIASDELNPQKARILLSLALLKQHTPKELQDMFGKY